MAKWNDIDYLKNLRGYLMSCYDTYHQAELQGGSALDSLKDLHFWRRSDDEEQHTPDYAGDGTTVAYYQLRYALGYACEYALVYAGALEWLKERGVDTVQAVSVGCGNGVDYLSLMHAASQLGFDRCPKWRGCDIQRWAKPAAVSERFRDFPGKFGTISIYENGATDLFRSFANSAAATNMLFFPRVLSELSPSAMDELCDAVRQARFSSEHLMLCIANRSPLFDFEQQQEATQESRNVVQLLAAFLENGYHSAGCEGVCNALRRVPLPNEAELLPSLVRDGNFYSFQLKGPGYSSSVHLYDASSPFYEGFRQLPNQADQRTWEPQYSADTGELVPSVLAQSCTGFQQGLACMANCPHADWREGLERFVCPLNFHSVKRTSQMSFCIIPLVKGNAYLQEQQLQASIESANSAESAGNATAYEAIAEKIALFDWDDGVDLPFP